MGTAVTGDATSVARKVTGSKPRASTFFRFLLGLSLGGFQSAPRGLRESEVGVSEEGDGFTGELVRLLFLFRPQEMRHMSNCSLNLTLIKHLSEERLAPKLTATGRGGNKATIGRLICHGFALKKKMKTTIGKEKAGV